MPVQTTSAICSRWILRFTIFIVLYCDNTITYWDFFGIYYRSTLKRRTKVISSLQEKCHCQSYTSWCHWYSSCRVCFGCSYWKRARKYFFSSVGFCHSIFNSIDFQFHWVNLLYFHSHTVFRIHYIMSVLVFLKSLSLMFHSINYHYIDKEGEHIEAWAILYYVTHL